MIFLEIHEIVFFRLFLIRCIYHIRQKTARTRRTLKIIMPMIALTLIFISTMQIVSQSVVVCAVVTSVIGGNTVGRGDGKGTDVVIEVDVDDLVVVVSVVFLVLGIGGVGAVGEGGKVVDVLVVVDVGNVSVVLYAVVVVSVVFLVLGIIGGGDTVGGGGKVVDVLVVVNVGNVSVVLYAAVVVVFIISVVTIDGVEDGIVVFGISDAVVGLVSVVDVVGSVEMSGAVSVMFAVVSAASVVVEGAIVGNDGYDAQCAPHGIVGDVVIVAVVFDSVVTLVVSVVYSVCEVVHATIRTDILYIDIC
ncbi:PREDICTED: uncharacterized protein LOC105562226 [Vollenhovia emeryi]|uniref:uncharacterized protein LOC105562226 n=1 Tax=Vollenhovia emeryi TaxID=411798 RepID=UPI0005F4D845|nr:PREDICTED: uncharacterized protein LOC105562226 [Vollenhovia emeryi]